MILFADYLLLGLWCNLTILRVYQFCASPSIVFLRMINEDNNLIFICEFYIHSSYVCFSVVLNFAPNLKINFSYYLFPRYWKLSLLVHPDKCSHPEAHQAFVKLNKAFKELQDPEKVSIQNKGFHFLAAKWPYWHRPYQNKKGIKFMQKLLLFTLLKSLCLASSHPCQYSLLTRCWNHEHALPENTCYINNFRECSKSYNESLSMLAIHIFVWHIHWFQVWFYLLFTAESIGWEN